MEDFGPRRHAGQGPSARSIRLDLPRFTLVGATTRTGSSRDPWRDRFGFVARLRPYGVAELEEIVLRSARLLGVELTTGRSGGDRRPVPRHTRLAIRLLRRVRDFVEVRGAGVVTLEPHAWACRPSGSTSSASTCSTAPSSRRCANGSRGAPSGSPPSPSPSARRQRRWRTSNDRSSSSRAAAAHPAGAARHAGRL